MARRRSATFGVVAASAGAAGAGVASGFTTVPTATQVVFASLCVALTVVLALRDELVVDSSDRVSKKTAVL